MFEGNGVTFCDGYDRRRDVVAKAIGIVRRGFVEVVSTISEVLVVGCVRGLIYNLLVPIPHLPEERTRRAVRELFQAVESGGVANHTSKRLAGFTVKVPC